MKKSEENDSLYEFVHTENGEVQLQQEEGILSGVKILGLVSKNGRRYPPETLLEAKELYEGAKVNVNHPKGDPLTPRDYQDRIGYIRNVVFRPEEGLYADLYFNPHHPLAEQLIWDAANAPKNVGFSHNIRAKTVREGDTVVVKKILAVQSVDLVADPATTSGLFESERAETLLLEVLREELATLQKKQESLQRQWLEWMKKQMPCEMPSSREQASVWTQKRMTTEEFVRKICR
ncbi:MAG: hypothetical protein Q4E67_00585 [Planctomycetia bacterium]|nr:hypothetical protein [Planctomycetia bacterium]